ncbi:MAG: 23S rRNA (adenine(2503)-C(2))-methyltransferase RlmN, partial [Planctomycetes bacterium]|nr:23S rRNA (adenine(2503)-C(2))-methyltransferase RlmN [Planctomycetota bacterium]
AAAIALSSGHGIATALYPRAMRDGVFSPESHPVSAATIAGWRARFSLGLLPIARVAQEPDDPQGTAKAILTTSDGSEIECVRIPMRRSEDGAEQTYTLCLSSQVGCRMGCTFCETGRMGLLRNLTAAEIVGQVVSVRAVLGWRARNLVFMGMGEALDNVDHLIQALRVLTDRRGLGYSHERITICTSGHGEGITRLAQLGWKRLNLSISLNAANDADRSRMMPVNRKTPLAELQRILAAYPQRRNFTLGVNYCLLPGINDRREDARGIADFCRPLGRTLVNLIPYNPGSSPVTRPPSEDEIDGFIGWLREEGLPVRRRVTKGRSIMAACGQLGNVGLRQKRRAQSPPPAAQ